MADFPLQASPPSPLSIFPSYSLQVDILNITASAWSGSAAWPTPDLAIFVPFSLGGPLVVTHLFNSNGTVASGNIDVGVYDRDGVRIVSAGSTTMAGVNTIQTFNITDTLLVPGLYWLGVALNNTTGTVVRLSTVATNARTFGVLEMASAFPLPATATYATLTNAGIPDVGLTGALVV